MRERERNRSHRRVKPESSSSPLKSRPTTPNFSRPVYHYPQVIPANDALIDAIDNMQLPDLIAPEIPTKKPIPVFVITRPPLESTTPRRRQPSSSIKTFRL